VTRPLVLLAAAALGLACAGAMPPTPPEPDFAPPAYTPGVIPDSFLVRLATTAGEMDVMLRREWAPHGVAQFYDAVSNEFYDGARFFRVILGFVAQFGIAADPAVTAAWQSRSIPDDPVAESNRRGTLVFAAGGPNTRTVQLFFNLRDNARLDAMGFAPLGEVIRGIDTMDSLHTGYGDGPGAPQQDRLAREGEAYLSAEFPLLDRIITARVVRAWFAPIAAATR